MAKSHDVIIVGAGVGGLTCAAFLAKAGLNVLVLEAKETIGGVCHTTNVGDFSFRGWGPLAFDGLSLPRCIHRPWARF